MISIVLFGQFVTNLKIILFDNLSVYSTLRFTSSWELEVITGHLLDNKKEITWSMTSRCIRSCSCCSLLRLLRRPLSLGDAVHNNEVETMSCESFFCFQPWAVYSCGLSSWQIAAKVTTLLCYFFHYKLEPTYHKWIIMVMITLHQRTASSTPPSSSACHCCSRPPRSPSSRRWTRRQRWREATVVGQLEAGPSEFHFEDSEKALPGLSPTWLRGGGSSGISGTERLWRVWLSPMSSGPGLHLL